VVALADEPEEERLRVRDETRPTVTAYLKYQVVGRNEGDTMTIQALRHSVGFPVTLSLLEVEVVATEEEAGQVLFLIPGTIVVDPDHLMDVTTIADCFGASRPAAVKYLLRKFMPRESTPALLLGHVANFMLDELMHRPDASFQEVFPAVYQAYPLAFARLTDMEVATLRQNAQRHWMNIKAVVMNGFEQEGISPADCSLEPAFIDETHGLQGRLDVLHRGPDRTSIVELKSGRAFQANQYQVGASHYIQTLLYDLMVRSVLADGKDTQVFILYSRDADRPLRFAPQVRAEQQVALQIRNKLVAIDRRLAGPSAGRDHMLDKLRTTEIPLADQFAARDLRRFETVYQALRPLERKYFNAFTGLIAREHLLTKTGMGENDRPGGQASLWLNTLAEKEASYEILRDLRIRTNQANDRDPVIVFGRGPDTNPLANFRPGDIAVLYPDASGRPTVSLSGEVRRAPLSTQIFKVTLVDVGPDTVTVRLRARQFNLDIFSSFQRWVVEHDYMDLGFTAMYQGLFHWASQAPEVRDLLLTVRAPSEPTPADTGPDTWQPAGKLTAEQSRILDRMIAAKEYFLLWGPPGTGKTSQMLRHFAQWTFERTTENLLLLAYTNRAVDEICDALDSLGEPIRENYLRIGSRSSTTGPYQDRFLSVRAAQTPDPAAFRNLVTRHRLFVGTLASLNNHLELLDLKSFDTVVIDEASQILEPALLGWLPRFRKFVLIGDHKQLPAVVAQPAHQSAVDDADLQALGLVNLRNSFFERLYKRCRTEAWSWAYDQLTMQGRMHRDIMSFPRRFFYEQRLEVLPPDIPGGIRQRSPLPPPDFPATDSWQLRVLSARMSFVDTPVDKESRSRKTNRHEAERIAELIRLFRHNGIPASRPDVHAGPDIGIITPYRAQIALLSQVLQSAGIDTTGVTIDTVERFQGGARDIILISLCTNHPAQLSSLVSLSAEGVDRKLCVALTRAREQVVVLGNTAVLSADPTYRALMAHCRDPLGNPTGEDSG
jgi:DNA replication ATP-dependent helicase Dna2